MDRMSELTQEIWEKLTQVLQGRQEIRFALLYGSAAEGRPFRDLDIGLVVDRAIVPASADLDYAFAVADELEACIAYPVDVRVVNEAPLPFRYSVSCGRPLVIHDREAFYQFLERTWDEFLDFEPVALQYLREMR